MRFVIDTSVAVKWFLPENGHEAAVALLDTKATFEAPDLIFTEFATAMQKKISLGETDSVQAGESCTTLQRLLGSVTPTLFLFERALEIALDMGHPVQDCIFLACADASGLHVVTADRKLIDRASKRGFEHLVFGIEDALSVIDRDGRGVALTEEQLRDIARLNRRVDATFDDLHRRHASSAERFHFVPAEAHHSVLQSPAYRRLQKLIEALPDDQLRDLIALCWLGRGYDGTDWSRLQNLAARSVGRSPSEISYVLSLMSHLPAGRDRVLAAQSFSDTSTDP